MPIDEINKQEGLNVLAALFRNENFENERLRGLNSEQQEYLHTDDSQSENSRMQLYLHYQKTTRYSPDQIIAYIKKGERWVMVKTWEGVVVPFAIFLLVVCNALEFNNTKMTLRVGTTKLH